MSATRNLPLPFDELPGASAAPDGGTGRIDRDRAARVRAVDPRHNVVLEASAGTGKTRVLVDRYVNLLRAGVDPGNILAMTFTRKAAAEMRERIVATLCAAAERREILPSRWRELRERLGDIAISTIDAFCLGLLREFPLEADVDPGFAMADDTEVPLLIAEALDRALRTGRALALEDEHVALVFAQLGDRRLRAGLTTLLHRRLVAPAALARFLDRSPADLTVQAAARAGATGLLDVFAAMPGGLGEFLDTGPPDAAFRVLGQTMRGLTRAAEMGVVPPPLVQAAFARAREYFLTKEGRPRVRLPYTKAAFASPADWRFHRERLVQGAPALMEAQARYRRDLNVLVARGVQRLFRIAEREYRRTLDAHAVLDFSDVLARTLDLLRNMEEFAQSRYRLESRYHHVLVDEFQDTSRAQWELVSLLVQSWGEGAGLAHAGPLPPSIFIVGDRKQSIYRFRDADVAVLEDARASVEALRADRDVRRSISRSFRSVPALLAFVNDVCEAIGAEPPGAEGALTGAARRDAFRYTDDDRFPIGADAAGPGALGIVAGEDVATCAAAVAHEVARLIETRATVRDRDTGVPRALRAGDVAVLFRTRESHREFETALEQRGIPSYVYKGLGFFDADEVRDVLALVGVLADPASDLRAAAWLRSGFVRLPDEGLRRLAPQLAAALAGRGAPEAALRLDRDDALVLQTAREALARWRRLVDRIPPAELIDAIVADAGYLVEIRGPRVQQARENLKKLRAIIRRMQNRGYLTLPRLAARLDRLAVGEEANAVIDAADAVNLMTIHAAKGLEFPVVFLVDLARGTGGRREAIRVTAGSAGAEVGVSVGDFEGEADEDAAAADREETKRLLYVALTRARDRLYLGAVRREGRLQPARGSLAEVLPAALLEVFAPAEAVAVTWRAASGGVHTFQRCATDTAEAPMPVAAVVDDEEGVGSAPADFARIDDTAPPRLTVAALVETGDVPDRRRAGHPDAALEHADRLLGTLVHRLLHRLGVPDTAPGDATLAAALSDALGETLSSGALLSDAVLSETVLSETVLSEIVLSDGVLGAQERHETGTDDVAGLARAALSLYRTFAARPDVHALYHAGEALHEVPFTMRTEDGFVRGTIDCLIRCADRVVLLEFKTGRPRPAHRRQADVYGRAAQLLFPGLPVETRIVYAGDAV